LDKKDTLLSRINSPADIRKLSLEELERLADEVRDRVIEVVSRNGGHLASNLGVADLTIALHYVFDFPTDRLLWDVGHQCYAHKLLTGRAGRFDTLRQGGGLSGFPSPAESDYDLFYTGHAGTAISTAAGLAWADKMQGRNDRKCVAVVGDASIVNGMSLEGLNNAALLKRQFLVILNDNSMAIDRTCGALAVALEKIRMTPKYADLKSSTEMLLKKLPLGGEITGALKHIREGLRTTLHGPRVFETLGFNYFGPISGHDIGTLIRVLQRMKELNRPVVLHVHTEKGRGCQYAVDDPCRFHSPSAHKISNGKAVFKKLDRPIWTQCFADILIEKAAADPRIVAITAAMPDGTGLAKFREKFHDRMIDVGISEEHAIATAAGMAKSGLIPVVAIYSTFMQRAFDQVFHELALQGLHVILCMDRAGLVGSDGAVHHGLTDVSFMRTLPGMTLIAPATEAELNAALDYAIKCTGPVAMRYPRDLIPAGSPSTCPPFVTGKAREMRQGKDVSLICYGAIVNEALAAADMLAEVGIESQVINARFVKPLDEELLCAVIATGRRILTIEDHFVAGGFGSAVLEMAAGKGLDASKITLLGVGEEYIQHDTRAAQLIAAGLDSHGIAEKVKTLL